MKQSVSEQTAAKFKVPFRKGCHQFHHANGNCNCIVVEQNFSVMTFKYSSPSSTYQTIRGDDANPKAMPKRLKLKLPISSLGNYVKEVLITSKSHAHGPKTLSTSHVHGTEVQCTSNLR